MAEADAGEMPEKFLPIAKPPTTETLTTKPVIKEVASAVLPVESAHVKSDTRTSKSVETSNVQSIAATPFPDKPSNVRRVAPAPSPVKEKPTESSADCRRVSRIPLPVDTPPDSRKRLFRRPLLEDTSSDFSSSFQKLPRRTSFFPAPVDVTFLVRKSSKNCGVKWEIPLLIEDPSRVNCILKVYEDDLLYKDKVLKKEDYQYVWDVLPGSTYKVELSLSNDKGVQLAYGTIEMKATFSLQEMDLLMKKALTFIKYSAKRPFSLLYRCKPEYYWFNICECSNNVMLPYLKDENGQPAAPINGIISGLFFSGKLLPNGELPPTSPFGNMRMTLQASHILDPTRVNFYFGDFYCNKIVHYVTVVVCLKDTACDTFCDRKLIKLNPENEFFTVRRKRDGEGFDYFMDKKVYVEIYYTDAVPLSWGKFDRVEATGIGTSRIGGLQNNKECQECNLYPVRAETQPKSIAERIRGVGSTVSRAISNGIHKVQKKITKHQTHEGRKVK